MASQAGKSVDELTQMYNKLIELGLYEKFMEEARLNEQKKEVAKEVVKETVPEKIDGVLKIESWTEDNEKTVKIMQLISADDFTKIYNVKDKETFAYDVLELDNNQDNGININKKPIITSKKIYGSLVDQIKIDLTYEGRVRIIKVEKNLAQKTNVIGLRMLINGESYFNIKLVAPSDNAPAQLCMVKQSDFESFPTIGFVCDLDKDITENFCTIESWFYSAGSSEKVLVSIPNIRKIPVCKWGRPIEKNEIVITHAIEIIKGVAVEKNVIVRNKYVSAGNSTFNVIKRIYSSVDSAIEMITNVNPIPKECLFNGIELIPTTALKDESVYNATHIGCVIDKPNFESLTLISPKNQELSKTNYNKIYHFSLSAPGPMQTMLITASQYDTIKNNTNTVNTGACIFSLLRLENTNILEEIALSHTSWRDNSSVMQLYKFDNQEKSKWVKLYMRCDDFNTAKKSNFTFESKPAVFMRILLDEKMVDCLMTKDQLEKINMA